MNSFSVWGFRAGSCLMQFEASGVVLTIILRFVDMDTQRERYRENAYRANV